MNDKDLFSLRNLLVEIENASEGGRENKIQEVLEQTTLVRVLFTKLLQSGNFMVLGCVRPEVQNFNETLNTLEFLSKIKTAIIN
jgi:hypothetical protein